MKKNLTKLTTAITILGSSLFVSCENDDIEKEKNTSDIPRPDYNEDSCELCASGVAHSHGAKDENISIEEEMNTLILETKEKQNISLKKTTEAITKKPLPKEIENLKK